MALRIMDAFGREAANTTGVANEPLTPEVCDRPPDLAIPSETARQLINSDHLDVPAARKLLNALPSDVGTEARAGVNEAIRLVEKAGGCSSLVAVARYALARVIVLLEHEPE